MKNIIVPTDFSTPARNALDYAVNLANHFGSKIHLIHIYEVRSKTGMLKSVRDFMRQDSEQMLSEVVKSVKKQLLPHTTLEAKAVEGLAVDRICTYAQAMKADLIVMGTQGASGLKEIFIGSNAFGVIQKSEVPVLMIPNAFVYQPFKEIVLALDNQVITSPEVLLPLISIAKAYKAAIRMLHIELPGERSTPIDDGVDIFLKDVSHSFHTITASDINVGFNRFITAHQAELLCMIRRDRMAIERIFHTSATRKKAFDSPIPLLILRDL